MADNVTLPASLQIIATDDIAGVNYPRTKITIGTDGVNDGDVSSSNPLPITLSAIKAEDSVHISGDSGIVMLGIRSDGDSPTANDGDYTVIKLDEEGRIKVSVKPASYSSTIGNVTSATSTVFINCSRFSNMMIHCSGSFNSVNCIFEGSLNSTNGVDGNWFTVQAVRSNANTIETTTGVLSIAPVYAWELSVNALVYFRIRATAWVSGTQVWTLVPGTYATEPIPAAQISGTQPVSGTVTANQGSIFIANASIINSAATTNGTIIKASAGTIYGGIVSNTGASVAYLKFHNSTTVTVGTTAVAFVIPIPAGSIIPINFGAQGIRYTNGICLSITNLAVDTDTTAVALGQIKLNMSWG